MELKRCAFALDCGERSQVRQDVDIKVSGIQGDIHGQVAHKGGADFENARPVGGRKRDVVHSSDELCPVQEQKRVRCRWVRTPELPENNPEDVIMRVLQDSGSTCKTTSSGSFSCAEAARGSRGRKMADI